MNEPQISFSGHLGHDPVLRTTPGGLPVVDLRIATTRRFQVGEEWQDGETIWFEVACWRRLAENVGSSLRKGDKVAVVGKLIQNTWTRDDGSDSVKLMVDASSVAIDLERYPVRVDKPLRTGSAAAALAEQHDAWAAGSTPQPEDEIAA